MIEGNLPRKSNGRRITRSGLVIKSKKALDYEKSFSLQTRKGETIEGDLALLAVVYYDSRRPDLSDELLSDCLEKSGVIENDRQIKVKMLDRRLDKVKPRVEFELWSLPKYQENETNGGGLLRRMGEALKTIYVEEK